MKGTKRADVVMNGGKIRSKRLFSPFSTVQVGVASAMHTQKKALLTRRKSIWLRLTHNIGFVVVTNTP